MILGETQQGAGRSNVVVTGAGLFSLGNAVVHELSSTSPDDTVLAIDAHPAAASRANVVAHRFDLNPFNHADGFEEWSTELNALVRSAVGATKPAGPIRAVFLGAAKYHVGMYESTTAAIRAEVLGSNVFGKWETLHATMRCNAESGFDNAGVLSMFDVGSLHSMRHTSHRALYNPSKAAGLALCRVMTSGSEVRRAVHVAPGPIDTPMLHWNHWALKENGDPQFPSLVGRRLPSLYGAIFRSGDIAALETAIRELRIEGPQVRAVFERYRHRRKVLAESEEGITTPESLGAYLASLILDRKSTESGVVEVTSPHGKMTVVKRPFSHAAYVA